jgi:3-carboxy-cis,cis-muconate cycloisomerase
VSARRSGETFLPLVGVFGDAEIALLFSERAQIESWLEVECALAAVQAELGLIPEEAAAAITAEATFDRVDLDRLYEDTRTVGYPILPLVEQVASSSSPPVGAYFHWGATTQDIMDTGLVLQVDRALERVEELRSSLAEEIARLAEEHRSLPMAARTHAQQAVPTTLGAKLAVWVEELCRHGARLRDLRPRLVVVQLFGAAGTAAALGPSSREVRHGVAERLGVGVTDVPWHAARDGFAELGFVLAALASTCGKIAREIIELSRTEIGEISEASGPSRGASSTMPQKANPIRSEVVIGMSVLAREQVTALLAAMQTGHERSAGEWQIEWDAVPTIFALACGCLLNTREVVAELQVFPERMRANLDGDGGMVMAEAVMIALAPRLGRLRAHELVSEICREARRQGLQLADALPASLGPELLETVSPLADLLAPDAYLGEAEAIVDAAVTRLSRCRAWSRVDGAGR